jgi:hypothetical protein
MAQITIFDVAHLRLNLEEAVAKNCQVQVRDGTRVLCFQDVFGIRVVLERHAMAHVSEELSKRVSLSAPAGGVSLPNLMLEIAIYASDVGLKVLGPPRATRQLSELKRNVSADFALICSLSLARAHGHSVPQGAPEWDVMRSVLMVKDDDSLVRIFRESLNATQAPSEARDAIPNHIRPGRVLSAESFWNLVSMACGEDWPDSVTLQLIGEHLNPAIHPDSVPYSHTISGDEWRQIYERIYE